VDDTGPQMETTEEEEEEEESVQVYYARKVR
jgi:hypothetical protein